MLVLSIVMYFILSYLDSTYLRLATVLWEAGVPFLVCRTYGLVGYMRLAVKEHTGRQIVLD